MSPHETSATFTYELTTRFVDALVRLGLRDVHIAPGSRNTPLAITFAAHGAVADWSHHDERSCGFHALGTAKASRLPVAVVTTSGTAAAELLPAIVEARMARTPLLILTADRPPELRGVGAPQTIDQVKLYGDAVKSFHEVGVPDASTAKAAPSLAAMAWAESTDAPSGPVHLNFSFREPLVPSGPLPPFDAIDTPRYHPGRVQPTEQQITEIAASLGSGKTLVIAGPNNEIDFAAACAELAGAGSFPILADPLSGLRAGEHELKHVMAAGDLVAGAGTLDALRPDAVLRFGPIPTSKPVGQWLTAHPEIPQILVDEAGWRDPLTAARTVVHASPARAAAELTKAVQPGDSGWAERWREAERRAQQSIDQVLGKQRTPTEPAIARTVSSAAPAGAVLYIGSSMPIRDVDAFSGIRRPPLRYLGNRGANGIDGLLSSGFGAIAASGERGFILAGDLATLYDLTALGTAARENVRATVVVVHNDGGGIFDFLPQADAALVDPDVFAKHLTAPHGTDFVAVASALGVKAQRLDTMADLETALADDPHGPVLVEVRTDRRENVTLHRELRESVASALSRDGGVGGS